ncbi:MAG: SCO family protein [Hyphomicrobiales bacterium]|nr:SCO family protein [Hyphomicrobiales bacterium]MDE2113591.1 SCO family protein [Hyphomicrobiales bacterium]
MTPGLANPATTRTGKAEMGGAFTLVDSDNKPFSSQKLAGKPFAIFFGYTHCPDVCPASLAELTQDLAGMGAEADKLHVVFVSLDPERDTPAIMKSYLSAFDPRIVGLTGTPDAVAAVAKSYHVFWEKVPGSGADYTLNHTAATYLMNAAGEFAGFFDFRATSAQQTAKLKQLVETGNAM